ncbi:hypothetical protein [Caballeronia sp. INDeC2]|uniref:hypothetical protein n=1 Tax=Caballeronia sp. INDeC2 TaxID=2921747 RepID=UPI002029580A|nr:hypothetical protein [Caballeronia sp. INDeC2]
MSYVLGNEDDGYAYRSRLLDGAALEKVHKDIRVIEVSPNRAGGRIEPERKFQALALLQNGASVAAVPRGLDVSAATVYRYRKGLQGVVALRPRHTNSLLRMLAFPAPPRD